MKNEGKISKLLHANLKIRKKIIDSFASCPPVTQEKRDFRKVVNGLK